MSITDYATLKAAIADTLNRDDLTSVIPSFISLAEAHIPRRLRHWKMEKRSEASVTGQFTDLPVDWRETIRFKIKDGCPLNMVSIDHITKARAADNTAGEPTMYAHLAGEIEVYPSPAAATTLQMTYYADIPKLSDADTGNWLLTAAPDVYLYGALIHSAPYLKDDARLQVWGGLFADGIGGMNSESRAARSSGTGLARRA